MASNWKLDVEKSFLNSFSSSQQLRRSNKYSILPELRFVQNVDFKNLFLLAYAASFQHENFTQWRLI